MVNKSMIISIFLLFLSISISIYLLWIPINFNLFTNNKMMAGSKIFQLNNIIMPHNNSQYKYTYESVTEGNLLYYSPENTFFWFTGDGKLPTVNKVQIKYFKENYRIRPQFRVINQMGEGFKSVYIE